MLLPRKITGYVWNMYLKIPEKCVIQDHIRNFIGHFFPFYFFITSIRTLSLLLANPSNNHGWGKRYWSNLKTLKVAKNAVCLRFFTYSWAMLIFGLGRLCDRLDSLLLKKSKVYFLKKTAYQEKTDVMRILKDSIGEVQYAM